MHKSLVALCLLFSLSTFANQKAELAAQAYGQRDFNEVGIQNAQEAVKLYGEAIAEEADATLKLTYMGETASVHYFLGTALDKKEDKMAAFQASMDTAAEIMTTLGVDVKKAHKLSEAEVTHLLNNLDDANELILAETMYTRGISLSQWGNLKGIPAAINRLPEVTGLMERIEMMGYVHINEYGPYRTQGRIKFVLPKLFGGDLEASEDFLKRAAKGSLVPGQRYSINGYNNLYLAETYYKRGKENQAKKLLDTFINADFSTLKAGSEPENRQAIERAKELAEDWE